MSKRKTPSEPYTAQQIRQRRTKLGFSQERLAYALGVTKAAVQHWERGEAEPSLKKLMALAIALDCEVADLVPERPFDDSELMALLARLDRKSEGELESAATLPHRLDNIYAAYRRQLGNMSARLGRQMKTIVDRQIELPLRSLEGAIKQMWVETESAIQPDLERAKAEIEQLESQLSAMPEGEKKRKAAEAHEDARHKFDESVREVERLRARIADLLLNIQCI